MTKRKPAAKTTAKRKAPAKRRGTTAARTRKTAPKGGAMQRTGARLDDVFKRAWSGFLTYAAAGVTAMGLIALFALFAGGYFVNMGERLGGITAGAARAAGFSVSRVTLKGGHSLTEREVLRALWTDEEGSVLGRSLVHFDAEAARGKLEALGPVRYAAVAKLWPNTIHVSVIERSPEALWQDSGGVLHLIDGEGVSLRPVAPAERTDLPVIVGTSAPGAAIPVLSELKRHPQLLKTVAAIVSVSDRRYDLRFRNDFTAKLPEEGIEEALQRLEGLGAGTGKLASSLDYIDLRDPKWAYYKPKAD
ncbi:cell division protein FtsQ/DivIB [Parvularcula dongshanensis]|uniref:Cell division protein FtsQ n=1 Tax=Parvularcula dongshanensis TaxID=1173995 RepID=A0A840I6R2_9PROT|nr:cell division protein FtsQ [Parvularcula dongshanensis]